MGSCLCFHHVCSGYKMTLEEAGVSLLASIALSVGQRECHSHISDVFPLSECPVGGTVRLV